MECTLQELGWLQANRACEYCRVPQQYDRLPFEIDHIIVKEHRAYRSDQAA